MPPELPNHQELNLKKRARRRLVGAIALVLLMIIILPKLLKDREAPSPQDAIKITMTNADVSGRSSIKHEDDFKSTVIQDSPNETSSEHASLPEVSPSQGTQPTLEKKNSPVSALDHQTQALKSATDKSDTKISALSDSALNATDSGKFTLQIGVFSDLANVKQLQEKIKLIGFSSNIEKITTAKGDKIRLRAGSFDNRSEAELALAKLKQAGLPDGKVISNE